MKFSTTMNGDQTNHAINMMSFLFVPCFVLYSTCIATYRI